jgi:hypothetical protein
MKTGRGWWALAGLGVLTLLGLYVGAYYANVTAKGTLWLAHGGTKICFRPNYRVFETASRTVFAPMHAIDFRLRSDVWTVPADPDYP